MAAPLLASVPEFAVLEDRSTHAFAIPKKCIHEGSDMPAFLVSHAYRDILAFLMKLNRAVFPTYQPQQDGGGSKAQNFPLGWNETSFPSTVTCLRELLQDLDRMIEEAPPDPGPRRFGNFSFRTWNSLLEQRSLTLLEKHLQPVKDTINYHIGDVPPLEEMRAYLLGGFGSSQRLDYGTGHELSFMAFVGCIWKLGGFGPVPTEDDMRGIVLGVIQPYLELSRKLILTYNLEPAGSHGVWGLDDHSFLPYIFGSAQYGPAVRDEEPTPTEGSLEGAPNPGTVTSPAVVERERKLNLYFGAIGFIYDVKKGPFWEHSPTLYDISGVRAGWGKINKGMLKMYDAEVLGKFPVVQHFPFGSLFSFEKDPAAKPPAATVHTSSQPQRHPTSTQAPLARPGVSGTTAPWANAGAGTVLPRGVQNQQRIGRELSPASTSASSQRSSGAGANTGSTMPPPTKAPWAK